MSTPSSPKTAASPIDIQVRLTTILGPLPLLDHYLVDCTENRKELNSEKYGFSYRQRESSFAPAPYLIDNLISCLVRFVPLNPLFPNAQHFEYSGHESQVARYSALIFGILYGIVHQNTLQAKYDENKVSQGLATGFRPFGSWEGLQMDGWIGDLDVWDAMAWEDRGV